MNEFGFNLPDYKNPSDCADKVVGAIYHRSEEAERYVERELRDLDPDGSFHDTNVDEFLVKKRLYPIHTNKTPDIMLISNNILYIADVTVTRSPNDRVIQKRDKYDSIVQEIMRVNHNINVVFKTFAFHELGTNMDEISNLIQNIRGQFLYDDELAKDRLKDFFYDIKAYINKISSNVVDKNAYALLLLERSNNEDEQTMGSNLNVTKYNPLFTEKAISLSIFKEAEKQQDELLKTTPSISLGMVRSRLNEKNDNMKSRKPITAIPFLYNFKDNEPNSDIDLMRDYFNDLNEADEKSILTLLPIPKQINKMKEIRDLFNEERKNNTTQNKNRTEFLKYIKENYNQKTPYYSNEYNLSRISGNTESIYDLFKTQVNKQNTTKEAESIPSELFDSCIKQIELNINELGTQSEFRSTNLDYDMPNNPIREHRERENINDIEDYYEIISKSHGSHLCTLVRKFVQDIIRIPPSMKKGIYYSIPYSKSCINCVFTDTNFVKNNPTIYFCSITRFSKNKNNGTNCKKIFDGNIHKISETDNYIYICSKLHNYPLEKLSKLSNIDYEMRTSCMSIAVLLDLPALAKKKFLKRYIGLITLLHTDLHQKTSSILDLMKYLVAMPMSSHSRLDKLLLDKLNIMLKTHLDVWLIQNIFNFLELNIKLNRNRRANRIIMNKRDITNESFNITGQFHLFSDTNVITDSLHLYLTESQLLFQSRPKKLYNSQFIDKSAHKVAKNNYIYKIDELENQGWIEKGYSKELDDLVAKDKINLSWDEENDFIRGHKLIDEWEKFKFPYNSDFAFSRDAMNYAQVLEDAYLAQNISIIRYRNSKKIQELFPYNLNLRGSCIIPNSVLSSNPKEIVKGKDKLGFTKTITVYKRSCTSLLAGLTYMDKEIKEDDTENSKVGKIMINKKNNKMYFNMSEKEQRGDGRPIGSADFFTKQKLYTHEMIYQNIGKEQPENLLARGIHRGAKISSLSRGLIKQAVIKNYKYISNIVMDQSQFSESDNINKFICNIVDNKCIPDSIKGDLIDSIGTMKSRTQYFPRVPNTVVEEYPEYITGDKGIIGIAGWVQGMLNISSTHIHIIAVKWLVKMFNDYYKTMYPEEEDFKPIIVEQTVNSDDSFAIVAGSSRIHITRFYSFFVVGKRLFTLKQNIKKSYMSSLIGEVIQKYVANGSTVNIWAKDAVSVYNNTQGMDLMKDISTAIGSIQNICRNGAPEIMATYLRAELKSQIWRTYNLGENKINDLRSLLVNVNLLPIELGGWPGYLTTYELVMSGSAAQNEYCMKYYKTESGSNSLEKFIVMSALSLNIAGKLNKSRDSELIEFEEENDEDWEIKTVPVKYLNQVLTDEGFQEDIETFNGVEENYNSHTITREDNKIDLAFRSLGFEITYSNYVKSLINPFLFVLPFAIKITETIRKLYSFEGEGTGLSGLIKCRTSVKKAVVDIKMNTNKYLTSLSESGFNNSFRQKASAVSAIASNRCIVITGSKVRLTIRDAYKTLAKLSYKLRNKAVFNDMEEKITQTMQDPTLRSHFCEKIVLNTNLTGVEPIKSNMVTQIPRITDDLELSNDLQLVLCEYISPGILSEEGYTLRSTIQLENDLGIIENTYGEWFKNNNNKAQVAQSIYYHYLNVRRNRWFVGGYMQNSDLCTFLTSAYLTIRDGKNRYHGSVRLPNLDISHAKLDLITQDSNTVLSLFEIYIRCCLQSNYITSDKFVSNISVSLGGITCSIEEHKEKGNIAAVYNKLDRVGKMYLATLNKLLFKDDTLLSRSSTSEQYTIDWPKEQVKMFNTAAKRYTWGGHFIAQIQKGEVFVNVDGEPGKINKITSNTMNVEIITDLLFYFRQNNMFDNYRKPFNKIGFYNDGFFSSSLDTPLSKYLIRIHKKLGAEIINNVLLSGNTFEKIKKKENIPFEYIKETNYSKKSQIEYTGFEFNKDKSVVSGKLRKIMMVRNEKGEMEEKIESVNTPIFWFNRFVPNFNSTFIEFRNLSYKGFILSDINQLGCLKQLLRGNMYEVNVETLRKLIKMVYNNHEIIRSSSCILFNTTSNDNILPMDSDESMQTITINIKDEDFDLDYKLDDLTAVGEIKDFEETGEFTFHSIEDNAKSLKESILDALVSKQDTKYVDNTRINVVKSFISSGFFDYMEKTMIIKELDSNEFDNYFSILLINAFDRINNMEVDGPKRMVKFALKRIQTLCDELIDVGLLMPKYLTKEEKVYMVNAKMKFVELSEQTQDDEHMYYSDMLTVILNKKIGTYDYIELRNKYYQSITVTSTEELDSEDEYDDVWSNILN